jgi:hypothetical protein
VANELEKYGKERSCTKLRYTESIVGRDSSVGIATRYGLDDPGIESRWVATLSAPVQPGTGVHPASYTTGTGFLPGVERLGRGIGQPPHLAPRLETV